MLKKITLNNIARFENKEFTLADLTVVYGPDGLGKSTIVSAIRQALAGSDEGKTCADLVTRGMVGGSFSIDMFLKDRTYSIEKRITDKLATSGPTPQKIAAELGITKPALELLVDSWTILRKSESELASMIDKALNPNLSKEDIITAIIENLEAADKAEGKSILDNNISRVTGDTLSTLSRKLTSETNKLTEENETGTTTLAELNEKMKRTKELNLDKVKAAKAKSDILTLLKSREEELTSEKTSLEEKTKELATKVAISSAMVVKDLSETNKEIGKIELQLTELTGKINAVPQGLTETQNLPCKWFGKCTMDPDEILEMNEKSQIANRELKSKLELQVHELSGKLTKLKEEVNKIKLENAKAEQAQQETRSTDNEVTTTKNNITRLEKIVAEIKATIPEGVENIGSALMTMAEEVEEWAKEIGRLSSIVPSNTKRLELLGRVTKAVEVTKTKLRSTRLEDFSKCLITEVKDIYKVDVTYGENGLVVDGVRHNLMSMSQLHRIGIAIQYAMAKTTGLPLMVIDNMNVITDYSNIAPLIQKALNEGIQVIMFSSLRTIFDIVKVPEGKTSVNITLTPPVKKEASDAKDNTKPTEESWK